MNELITKHFYRVVLGVGFYVLFPCVLVQHILDPMLLIVNKQNLMNSSYIFRRVHISLKYGVVVLFRSIISTLRNFSRFVSIAIRQYYIVRTEGDI